MFFQDHDISLFYKLVPNLNWSLGLRVWNQFYEFAHPISPTPLSAERIEELRLQHPDVSPNPTKERKIVRRQPHYSFLPRFRATCYRTGENHSFSSEQVAREFGGAINDWFHWGVDMEDFDIEVVLSITDHVVRAPTLIT